VLLDLWSVDRKLLPPIGPGGRPAAPLRAYGKLELAPEYVDVGCDDRPEARKVRAWIGDGCKQLEPLFGKDPLRLASHRIVLTLDGGRVWAVACLWNSRDRRSDQDSQRSFPFVLFVLVPSPRRKPRLSRAGVYCEPLWSQLEHMYPTVTEAADRTECAALIRRQAVVVDSAREAAETDPLAAAEQIPVGQWLDGLGVGDERLSEVFLGELRWHVVESRLGGVGGRAWRFPLAEGLDTLGQMGGWLTWLERNLGEMPADFALFLPTEPSVRLRQLGILLRKVRAADFVGLSADPGHVDRVLGPGLIGSGTSSPGSGGMKVPLECRTLADFARWVLGGAAHAGR